MYRNTYMHADINECETQSGEDNLCGGTDICVDTEGSYSCIPDQSTTTSDTLTATEDLYNTTMYTSHTSKDIDESATVSEKAPGGIYKYIDYFN